MKLKHIMLTSDCTIFIYGNKVGRNNGIIFDSPKLMMTKNGFTAVENADVSANIETHDIMIILRLHKLASLAYFVLSSLTVNRKPNQ